LTLLSKLKNLLKNEKGLIYAYVLTTIKSSKNNDFIQTGSAPNFQGFVITLCTCKHFLRTWKDVDKWKDIWIAGFTSIKILNDNKNYLFYLMKIENAFSSFYELWSWLSDEDRKIKNARFNKLGDIYEPKRTIKDPHNPLNYYSPIKNHVHEENNE